MPPAASTFPFCNRVSVKSDRAILMLAVVAQALVRGVIEGGYSVGVHFITT